MVKFILDTNALLRFILKDVLSQYLEIYELIKKAKERKVNIFVPEVVVFETFFTLKSYYGYKKDTLLVVLESLLSADYLKIENKQIFMDAINVFRDNNLEFVDCFLISKSNGQKMKLFTFDINIKKHIAKSN